MTGGDLRSIGKVNELIRKINNEADFNLLIEALQSKERVIAMRAADAIEKITLHRGEFLQPHKKKLLDLLHTATEKEIRWHLAQIIPRLALTDPEIKVVSKKFSEWALDKKESRIVRVNSIQGLFELTRSFPQMGSKMEALLQELETENIPSLKARIKRLRKQH